MSKTTVHLGPDTLMVEKSYEPGLDRILLNGQAFFHGQLKPKQPVVFQHGERRYVVEPRPMDQQTGLRAMFIQVVENEQVVLEQCFNEAGEPVADPGVPAEPIRWRRGDPYAAAGALIFSLPAVLLNSFFDWGFNAGVVGTISALSGACLGLGYKQLRRQRGEIV